MRSIKAKLILLGAVSIVCTVILGFVGIYIMNSNNANNQVLNDINNINLKQNENTTQETSFLYDLDLSHYQTIQSNLSFMGEAAAEALPYSKGEDYEADLQSVASIIASVNANTVELNKLLSERGFKSGSGMYASYSDNDEDLVSAVSQMSGESGWADGVWDTAPLETIGSVPIGGKNYKKITYFHEIPDISKRNMLMIRLGGNGIEYTGDVYVTNIKVDGTEIAVADINPDILANSYGDGMSNVQLGTFDGMDAISIQTKFANVNGNWQEVTTRIDVTDINISDYKNISFELYFEEQEMTEISISTAFDGKYDFEGNLTILGEQFDAYNRLVAEGSDTGSYPDDIVALLNEMLINAPLYTKDQGIADILSTGFASKLAAVERIIEYDKDILALKAENNTLNTSLTSETSAVRNKIEELTDMQKVTLSSLIYGVFIVGAVLVVILTLFVITSVQKSIKKFKGTLTHISEGEIMVKAETGSGDEFDTFGRSLNRMTDKLSVVISDVKDCGVELNRSGADLQKMSQTSEQTSEQIDVAISEIAQGATNQARDVEVSTSEIGNLSNLMDRIDADVAELDETSINMKQASDEAVMILGDLSNSNSSMTEGIHRIAQQITRTNDSVREIEEAASLISSIADQTNLLSLNASIEAARAGEAGKGFAVVAVEIQQLADQSNNSADSIFGIINNLINEFKETLKIMDEVENATNEQNKKLTDTQRQFEIVNAGIAQSRDKTAVIKGAIGECSQVRNTVSEIMLSLSAISEENAASATETAFAMQQLNTTISELLKESQKLLKISSQLEQDMTFFKLG
ncbi:MAG: methyl-accepting chemotaxis protein [Lachnospiraceae bacterium]|nr:methyl-accepting chemotaxis protein [Lachnospiraceae bacterium]